MSFSGTARVGLKVTGYNEVLRAIADMQREEPQIKMTILRDASTFFVLKAKERVHKISGDLGRSIAVESITPQRAIVSAGKGLNYARKEEERKGDRRIPPHTPHTYMKPAAQDTSIQMPRMIKKGYDDLLRRHKTR